MPTPFDAPPAPSASNLGFVEDLYFAWLQDPASVDERWRAYFESLPPVADAARGAGPHRLACTHRP
jgi:2-oxoglutarate dehydrogenase E1 component